MRSPEKWRPVKQRRSNAAQLRVPDGCPRYPGGRLEALNWIHKYCTFSEDRRAIRVSICDWQLMLRSLRV